MKPLDEADLISVCGGRPDAQTSLAYDLFYGLGGIAGSIWSFFTGPMPDGWHRGFNDGYG